MNQQNAYFSKRDIQYGNRPSNKKIQDRAVESDNKMVEQTILLLAEGGIKAVTLETVGVNSGYSRGLVSRRYGSKEGLLIRVLDYLNCWVKDMLPKDTSLYGKAAMEDIVRKIACLIETDPKKIRAYYWLWFYALESSPEAHEKLTAMQNLMFEYHKHLLRQSAALEEITRNADIELMLDYIRTMMRGLVYSWMLDPNFDIVRRTNEFVDLHLQFMFKNSHLYDPTNFWGQ